MKRNILLFLLLFFVFGASAQDETKKKQISQDGKRWSFGINAGMNYGTFKTSFEQSSQKSLISDFSNYKYKVGFRFGAYSEVSFWRNFFVHMGLNASFKRVDNIVTAYKGSMTEEVEEKYQLWYLELPVQIGYQIPVSESFKIRISFGPYFSLGLKGSANFFLHHSDTTAKVDYSRTGSMDVYTGKGEEKYHDFVENQTNNLVLLNNSPFKRFDMGLSIGLAFVIHRLTISVGYDFGLVNYANQTYWDPEKKNKYKHFNRGMQATIRYQIY